MLVMSTIVDGSVRLLGCENRSAAVGSGTSRVTDSIEVMAGLSVWRVGWEELVIVAPLVVGRVDPGRLWGC